MWLPCFRRLLIVLICFLSVFVCQISSAVVKQDNNATTTTTTSLSKQNVELLSDMRWFFNGIETFSETMEDMLPKINVTAEKRQLSESSKLNLLVSLREFFGGLRQIARSMKQTFSEAHMRQLEQLKGATDFVHEQLNYVRAWLGDFRAWITQIFRLYDYYVPEVLLSKCVVKYIRCAHANRSFYEYPLIFVADIFQYYMQLIAQPWQIDHLTKEVLGNNHTSVDISNEIQIDDEPKSENLTENMFKNTKIRPLINCLKLYTVESVSRQFKTYFFDY